MMATAYGQGQHRFWARVRKGIVMMTITAMDMDPGLPPDIARRVALNFSVDAAWLVVTVYVRPNEPNDKRRWCFKLKPTPRPDEPPLMDELDIARLCMEL